MKIDKQQAVQLRMDGFSYGEIAERLGCSKGWCALNLKGVQQGVAATGKLSSAEMRQATLDILERAAREVKALT